VVINPDVSSDSVHIVPLIVSVEESKRWDFRIGAGYSTDDRFRVSLLFTKRAFLGGDRTLEVGVKHSYTWPIDTYIKFTQPSFILRGVDFILNPYYSIDREVDYTVDRLGSNFTFDKDFGRKQSVFVAYTWEKSKLTSNLDTTQNENENVSWDYLSGVTVGYQFKTTNSIFDPKKGWALYLTNGLSGLFFDKAANYYKISVDLRRYQPLGKEFILALRTKLGYMLPMLPDESTPVQERFLLGGSNSVRGYGRNTIGIKNDEGATIGGNSMMEGSLEFRYPIVRSFRGAVFLDAGNTWEKSGYYSFRELKYSLGLGLRYSTPIGPIRLDMATPVINDPFSFHFYITIGQAF
jgi:outer membrane protein insertion porin family